MSTEEYSTNPLWLILVETVHAMIMYPHHKSYVRDIVLHEKANVSSQDLASSLGIPFGEALVIIHELGMEKASQLK
ncbi:MAG: hypothetical protein QG670_924 [Thermoproteota archaeon]|nr:hypothetical protein [Thermoproteota archaeon]